MSFEAMKFRAETRYHSEAIQKELFRLGYEWVEGGPGHVITQLNSPFILTYHDGYIGRGSKWGNPYSHKTGTKAKYVVGSREEAISKYEEYIKAHPELMDSLHELKDKTLGCWCKPKACHGDILKKLVEE